MDSTIIDKTMEYYDHLTQTNLSHFHLWYEHVLFSWQWCLLVLTCAITWISWIKFRKKASSSRLYHIDLV